MITVSLLSIIFAYTNLPKDIPSGQLTSLLNTLAQIQASILAIIVSLTLIVVQLASQKYSMRISSMFLKSWQFWIFFIVYFISLLFDIGIKIFFPNLLNRWALFIGFSLFSFSFTIMAIYTKSLLTTLPPEKLIKSLLKSLNPNTITQYLHAPTPSKDPLFPVKEILNALTKERDYKGIEMVIGALFERIQEECTDVSFVSRFLESKKETYTPIQDIYISISAYTTYFLFIPLEILENAYKFRDIKLFEIGLATFRGFISLLFGAIDQSLEHLRKQNNHAHNNISEMRLRIALDHLILDALNKTEVQFNRLLKLYERGDYEEYAIMSIYNDQILPLYGVLGHSSSKFIALSASVEVKNAIINSTTRILEMSKNGELQENVIYEAVSTVQYIIQKTLEQLIKISSESTVENIHEIQEIFGDQVGTLKQLTTISIFYGLESPAFLGSKIIDANFEQLHRLVEAGITFPLKYLMRALIDILTNMEVDFEEWKLKPDNAVYSTKYAVMSINDLIEEFSADCDVKLLKFFLEEIERLYKIAHERYKFCWPYHERAILTSNSLIISLENLLINNCHDDSLIEMTTNILTSLAVNILQNSTQTPWEKEYLYKEYFYSAKHITEHLIYLGYVLVKYEKIHHVTNLSKCLLTINKKAEELKHPKFVSDILKEIKEKKEIGVHKKKQGAIPASELWVKLSEDDLKILEKFEKMYLDIRSGT